MQAFHLDSKKSTRGLRERFKELFLTLRGVWRRHFQDIIVVAVFSCALIIAAGRTPWATHTSARHDDKLDRTGKEAEAHLNGTNQEQDGLDGSKNEGDVSEDSHRGNAADVRAADQFDSTSRNTGVEGDQVRPPYSGVAAGENEIVEGDSEKDGTSVKGSSLEAEGGLSTSKCSKSCSDHGTCNEELGRCDCLGGFSGSECTRLAMPSCHFSSNHYTPCHLPSSCSCVLDCQEAGFATGKVCYEEAERNRASKDDVNLIYKSQQVILATDGRGKEIGPRRPAEGAEVNTWATSPEECASNCSGRGVCNRNSKSCECAGAFSGPACSKPGAKLPFACFNGCNGNGVCSDGVCKCEKPFFGMDCSLYVDVKGVVQLIERRPFHWTHFVDTPEHDKEEEEEGGKLPRLYIYDLPPPMTTWLYQQAPPVDRPEALLFAERALNSEFRTVNPEEADFFFVPAFFRWHGGGGAYIQQVVDYISATWPYWNRTRGSDHIFLADSDWGSCGVDNEHSRGLAEPTLGKSIILSLWGYTLNMLGQKERPCFVKGKDIALPPWMPPRVYRRIPYWGGASLDLEHQRQKRTTLLFFVEGLDANAVPAPPSGGATDYDFSFGVTQNMVELFGSREEATGVRMVKANGTPAEILEGLETSTFCLAPSGWGWSVHATQALQMGCIPVVIQPNVMQPFEYDLLNWDHISLRLTTRDIPDIVTILRAIPEEEIEAKRESIKEVWMRLVWVSPSSGPFGKKSRAMSAGDARILAQKDVFMSVVEILRLRLEHRKHMKAVAEHS